jgi:hypothetical protein
MAGVPRGLSGIPPGRWSRFGLGGAPPYHALHACTHTDILNSHDYIHESKLRMEILLGMLASAKEEVPSFLAVILEGRQGKTACGDALPSYLK